MGTKERRPAGAADNAKAGVNRKSKLGQSSGSNRTGRSAGTEPSDHETVEQLPPRQTLAGEIAPGLNLIGFPRAEIGIGESAGLAARALESATVPYGMIHFTAADRTRMNDMSWLHKEIEQPLYNTNMFNLNANSLLTAQRRFGPLLFESRNNIGYLNWELPEYPDAMYAGFPLVLEVWVPTRFVEQAIVKKSPVPVVRIPHGIEVNVPDGYSRDYFGLPQDRYLFGSIYDMHSCQSHKNPEAAVDAFKMAFGPDEKSASLVIQVNNAESGRSDILNLKKRIDGIPNIHLIGESMTRSEVNALLQQLDCFVSLHRSVGFGLIMAEAMYLGKPVIATNWSGNTDYMNELNCCSVNYQLVRLADSNGTYETDPYGAEPDIGHAAYYMRKLVETPEWGKALAAVGQARIKEHFSPAVAGRMMRQRLQELGFL